MKKLTKNKALEVYRSYLASCGLSVSTISLRLSSIKSFIDYLKETHGLTDLRDVGRDHIQGYIKHLNDLISRRTGRLLSSQTKTIMLIAVKQMFSCLYIEELILVNPAQDVALKKKGQGERRVVLSQEEIARLLDGIEGGTPGALRDRVLFELMYSSGLRVGETVKLQVGDIDFENRMILVRKGKRGKDRVVPVSRVGIQFLKEYVSGKEENKEDFVFRGGRGGRLNISYVNKRFKKWAEEAGVKRKRLSVHSIKHSVGTHLLEKGADIRYVQELLGHESIETTVAYTHSLYESLKRIYKSFHPRENEYYKEVDEEYRMRLDSFAERLKSQNVINAKRREYWRRRRKSRGN